MLFGKKLGLINYTGGKKNLPHIRVNAIQIQPGFYYLAIFLSRK